MMRKRWWILGYLVAMAVVMLAPLASPDPDGLERVAEDAGFIDAASAETPYRIIPDYVVPGIDNDAVATIVAGWIGVTLVFLIVFGLASLAQQRLASRRSARAGG